MTDLEGCINFWKSMLQHNRFVMSISTITQIENTIKFLEELQKVGKARGGK